MKGVGIAAKKVIGECVSHADPCFVIRPSRFRFLFNVRSVMVDFLKTANILPAGLGLEGSKNAPSLISCSRRKHSR